MKEHDMAKADFVTSIVLFLFGVAVLILSLLMPTYAEMGRNPYSAPGLVPGLLGVIISLLSIVMFVRSIIRKGHRLGLNGPKISGFFVKQSTVRILVTVTMSILYALVLLGRVNYVVSTIIYVLAFIAFFEYDRRKTSSEKRRSLIFAFIEALIVALVVAGIFRYIFLVNLP